MKTIIAHSEDIDFADAIDEILESCARDIITQGHGGTRTFENRSNDDRETFVIPLPI